MLRFGGKAVALLALGFGQVARHVTGFMMGGGQSGQETFSATKL